MAIKQVVAYADGQGRLFKSAEEAREADRLSQALDRRERLRGLIGRAALPCFTRLFGSGSIYSRLDDLGIRAVAETIAVAIETRNELGREIVRQLEEQG